MPCASHVRRSKKSHDNMWWQLVDARNNRAYYFNAATQVTKWERPANADIIPLAKLQVCVPVCTWS